MDDEVVDKKSLVFKWGIIAGLMSIIFFVILDIAGQSSNQSVRWLGLIISVTIIFFSHQEFKNKGDGYLSYGQGLGIGTLISLVSALINSVFTFIYVSFINDEMIILLREQALMDMENSGRSDTEIEQATPILEMMTSPIAIAIIGVFVGAFLGFIVSLIVSIFTKKNSPEFS